MSCKQCEILTEHNRYLQSLVDKLLMSQGIAPVHPDKMSIADKVHDLMAEETVENFASTAEEYGEG